MRPLIGISTYREQARWGYWDVPAVLLPADYADAVADAGGEPVLLPAASVSASVVSRLDGLVLAGGADVDPARYGEEPGPHTTAVRPDRDASEIAVLQAALERDLPLLAICRGMQLLDAVLGGSLVQHLPDVPGTEPHQLAPGLYAERKIRTAPGSTRRADRAGRHSVLPPPPGPRPDRPRPDAVGLGGGRRRRGGRGAGTAVLRRRPVAPRGGRGPPPVRGPGRRGRVTGQVVRERASGSMSSTSMAP